MAETGQHSPTSKASVSPRAATGVKRLSPWKMPLAPEADCGERHCSSFHHSPDRATEAAIVGSPKRSRFELTMPHYQCFELMNDLEKETSPRAAHVVSPGIVRVWDSTISTHLHTEGDEIEMLLMPLPEMLLETPKAPTFSLRATGQVTASNLSAYLSTKLPPKDAMPSRESGVMEVYHLHASTDTGDVLIIPAGMTMGEVADVFQEDGKQLELYYCRRLH
ncbi:hypothetical protein HPB51_017784 [Rhipicephalus microplus]|uniref:Uncharacterized protein n=1 Tax=Rhipicephalus microplus TaxID=6941 RepID=A0A9J6EB41_RHIMP|nr:hypothetical protein HPB51_017784 [Rhipicephalus microplus]